MPLTPAHIEQFNADGFLILDRFLSAAEVDAARARFEPLFRGASWRAISAARPGVLPARAVCAAA